MTAPLRATYRLQLGTDLDFTRARELVPYLAELGASHVYLSPSFQARPGSTHGYDVIDPGRVSDALGGDEGLRALADTAHEHGMGLILDIVPNHMAADDGNRFWADPALREQFFDVDPATGRWRRFFDIDELAAVRIEDPEVFAAVSELALRLVAEGVVDGLRVDHPDGLTNPVEYLRRLREGGAEHVWVEKILNAAHPPEELRGDWPVEGTVGYEFANDVAALFVDPAAEAPLTELYASLVDDPRPFGDVAAEAKLEQASTTFSPEVQRLRRLWPEVPDLEAALASLPIYRTYVEPDVARVDAADREALAEAEKHGLPAAVRRVLTLDDAGVPAEFVRRFQQTTPPVMAKGVEDTAFYRYVRLLALNEVGGDPSRFGISVDTFHAANMKRLPNNLLVSSTHDTKRSGDVRARLVALTAIPDEWAGAVRSWFEVNAPLRDETTAHPPAPTPAEELLIYQTLVGAWPIEADRLEAYLEKALREAKVSSNWIEPDEEHEAAVKRFAVDLLDHGPFRYGFDAVAARVAELGARVALSQTLLKLTVPGLPDVYQGDELWAYSLVDPDNRRPVDWAARREALAALRAGAAPTAETAKLHLVAAALDLRRRRPEAFATNNYVPVPAGDEVVAFLRGGDVLVAVAARDGATGAGGWELPAAAAGCWRDVLTGEAYELPDGATLGGVLGPDGRALLERVG
jgi:(1->4)-alpha-D-glucan 1-alpha-D-glucosylmutase